MAGIGNASRKGILIKSGEALENAGRINTIAFDKTGTITSGNPEVIDIVPLNNRYDEKTILSLASSAEKFSEHPLGKAVYKAAQEESLNVIDPQKFKIELGKGVTALINNKKVIVGNQKIIKATEEQVNIINSYENQGKTVLMVAVENSVIGLITVADKIKNKSMETIHQLKEMGINKILLLTGDNKNVAHSIAKQVGINDVYAEQLPEGKVHVIENHLNDNKKVCMIGDGINDAPALAISDVSVAMGALGADVAIETADIALMSDDISKIPELIDLSKKVMSTININIAAPILINFAAIMLAAFGIIGPVAGALIHNLGSVLVVANSSRLIKYRTNHSSPKKIKNLNMHYPLKTER
jgi:heavy metal translocating P-type ATPase